MVDVSKINIEVEDYELSDQDKQFLEAIKFVIKKKIEGTERYGPNSEWKELGLKGLFCDIRRKYIRLKYAVWNDGYAEGKTPEETLLDTYCDAAACCGMSIMLLEEESKH